VVVHKVDRLTRSLADFAKLVELFEQQLGRWAGSTRLSLHRQEGRRRARGGGRRPLDFRALSCARLDRRLDRGPRSSRDQDQAASRINGQVMGSIRFGVGALAYLLKNRFYIGEIVYRGETHFGEHEPILDRDLFAAVQAKLAASAGARQLRLKGSPAILTGRIFDDRGNRMSRRTPTSSGGPFEWNRSIGCSFPRQRESQCE
jgi:Recombinase